jgi:hypothetical protein
MVGNEAAVASCFADAEILESSHPPLKMLGGYEEAIASGDEVGGDHAGPGPAVPDGVQSRTRHNLFVFQPP